ncbi:MAG: hypothetical protein IGR76_15270 [Synechococcales cyanobacterium T60_A2020_003]|nr:hypothetical protein [Synechococcales cyanobacterium T60_A2020_003]
MAAFPKAKDSGSAFPRTPRRNSRLWILAASASLALHGGVLAGVGLLGQRSSTPAPSSIPVELIELDPAPLVTESPLTDSPPNPADSSPTLEIPSSVNTEAISEVIPIPNPVAPVPSVPEVAAIAPAPSPSSVPLPEPPALSSQAEPRIPEVSPSTEVQPANKPNEALEPSTPPTTNLPSPALPPAPPPANTALAPNVPSLPALPSTFPGDPSSNSQSEAPSLPSISVAEANEPVEITASVRVRSLLAESGVEFMEQSDRQTFIYDPTGQSGLAIATCPFVPEVRHFAGETVSVQVQVDATGAIADAQIYKSSSASTAYETFATCLAKNWDFSRFAAFPTSNTTQLIVLVTVEQTRS